LKADTYGDAISQNDECLGTASVPKDEERLEIDLVPIVHDSMAEEPPLLGNNQTNRTDNQNGAWWPNAIADAVLLRIRMQRLFYWIAG
jgi:hypothetical protein